MREGLRQQFETSRIIVNHDNGDRFTHRRLLRNRTVCGDLATALGEMAQSLRSFAQGRP
jgi:hypothetical protein